MNKADKWVNDHQSTTDLLKTLKTQRPRLQLGWKRIVGGSDARHAYPVLQLNDSGNVELWVGADHLFTLDRVEAAQIADFLRDLFEDLG